MPNHRFPKILLTVLLAFALFLPCTVVEAGPLTPAVPAVDWLLAGWQALQNGVAQVFGANEAGPLIDPDGEQVQPADTTTNSTESSPPDGSTEAGPLIDPNG